jgi:integrase
MASINFTAARIQDFQCPDSKVQDFLWDTGSHGLGLCVSKTSRTYVFQSRLNGKSFRMKIGTVASWRLAEVRTYANELQVMVDKGVDPRQVKKKQHAADRAEREAQERTAERDALTLGVVWPVYLAARKAKWSDGHYNNHVNLAATGGQPKKRGKGLTVAGPIASLLSTPLTSLTSEKIKDWLDTESTKRATNAAQSFRILRALATWAKDEAAYRDLIPPDAFTSRKVQESLPKNQAKEGDSLDRDQLKAWFTAVRAINNAVLSTYLQGLLITGARRNELAALKWQDVDSQRNKIEIHDKVEGTRTIPLTPYLSSLLSTLPRQNEWVFSSTGSASGHIVAPTKAHQSALRTAGISHVSIHGLRRSFITLADWLNPPSGLVAQIVGHKPSAVAEKFYKRRSNDFLREWHVKIEAWILTEAGIAWNKSN